MSIEIRKELIELIHALEKQGKNKNQISKILNISWTTVDKYWENNKNEITETKETNQEKKEGEKVTRDEYKLVYTMFDEGKTPVDVIKETGLGNIATILFDQYRHDKGVRHPKVFYDYLQDLENVYTEILKTVREQEKKTNQITEAVTDLILNYNNFINSIRPRLDRLEVRVDTLRQKTMKF